MDTKESVKKLYEKIGYDDSISVDTNDKLIYIQKFPYDKKDFMCNALFWFCTHFLQPGTNMLIMADKEGNQMPILKDVLQKLSHWEKPHFDNMFAKMTSDGIIMCMRSCHLKRIYMNPAFVIKGNSFSKFLLDMFMISADNMMGEHLFAVDGTRYKMNRRSIENVGKSKLDQYKI